jgi:ribose 5-phosphate isomerase B
VKVYLTCDHAGFELKNALREHLFHNGFDVEDIGPDSLNPQDDYPQFAYNLTAKVLGDAEEDARGIIICGSGQGAAIAANRVRGIRAAVVWNQETAKETRQDNDSNILALAARFIDTDEAFKISEVWLKEKFSGAERHKRRLAEIEELYG